MIETLAIRTKGKGLYEITDKVLEVVRRSKLAEGSCTVFIQHTSASLVIQENADPSARYDLERWIEKLIPEDDPEYTHTLEGEDDMPAHIKAALTPVSLTVPVAESRLMLGEWQGIYVWEHRRTGHTRRVVVQVSSV